MLSIHKTAGAPLTHNNNNNNNHASTTSAITNATVARTINNAECGVLVVGLGGANGTTLLAGVLANQLKLHWKGPQGQDRSYNYNGCLTQLTSMMTKSKESNDNNKGAEGSNAGVEATSGVGYADRVQALANANRMAIGGWDIRPIRLGDALMQAQILDYDLVRQVQDRMNQVEVLRGVYDPRFIGSSQHATATHILLENDNHNDDDSANPITMMMMMSDADKLKCLRADIRSFKRTHGLLQGGGGHTTVIWSASVEPNCAFIEDELTTAQSLLACIELSEQGRGGFPIPPSLLYATAAVLEGCSFINGGSQNTLSCPGLIDLARQQQSSSSMVYVLGTDFKAGQTKFKTATVEYLRTMGLVPRVIASSNHLGNNDMRNLATSTATSTAKLRVKHDIFAPWNIQQLDHKVSIMYTPFINDEKRDVVEYTSIAFLDQVHTMVTYTRASDSVLCVPLMLDGAVWCDYFAKRQWPYEKVAHALAYLFKLPEGAATGVDPGFFCQMRALETQMLTAAHSDSIGQKTKRPAVTHETTTITIPTSDTDTYTEEWMIPHAHARIVCAGLACVDMQLNHATGGEGGGGGGGESIESFQGETSMGGGSVSMACKTLARLCHFYHRQGERMRRRKGTRSLDHLDHDEDIEEDEFDSNLQEEVIPSTPVVSSVVPLCKIGNDSTGEKLMALLEACGSTCRNVETQYVRMARRRMNNDHDPEARTALSVLPIYQDGRRGCFFDAASNVTFSAREMITMIASLSSHADNHDDDLREEDKTPVTMMGAFVFGYPHLLPLMQGAALAQIFVAARSCMTKGGMIVLDMNGVPQTAPVATQKNGLAAADDLRADAVIGAALEHVDILHLNEDELMSITGGSAIRGTPESEQQDDSTITAAVERFLTCGVAVVAVTRGKKGCYIGCNDAVRFQKTPMLPASWIDGCVKVDSVALPSSTNINSNGAGDAFTAGLLVASMLRRQTAIQTINDSSQSSSSNTNNKKPIQIPTAASSSTFSFSSSSSSSAGTSAKPNHRTKKITTTTPYALYMREKYVMLKSHCNNDKKAIFARCHEMWEAESEEVKAQYSERLRLALLEVQVEEKEEENDDNEASLADNSIDNVSMIHSDHDPPPPRSSFSSPKQSTLNLETAARFASLVAAYHIDCDTRDAAHLEIRTLLQRSVCVEPVPCRYDV